MAIGDNFTNLPLETLIAAPLSASAKSNVMLAMATYEFINTVWVDKEGKPRMLQFPLERPITTGGTQSVAVNAPFAALAQLPNLMIKTVDIDFTVEVKDSFKHEDSLDTEVGLEVGASYGWFSAKLSGKVTTHSANTRQSDQSAKYDLRVRAEQMPPTEGMSKLAQIFASVIEPLAGAKT